MKDSEWYESLGREVSAIVGKMMYESIRSNEPIETTKENKFVDDDLFVKIGVEYRDKRGGYLTLEEFDAMEYLYNRVVKKLKKDHLTVEMRKGKPKEFDYSPIQYRIEQPTLDEVKKENPNISEKFIACVYNYITTRQKIVKCDEPSMEKRSGWEKKLNEADDKYNPNTVILGGGVEQSKK